MSPLAARVARFLRMRAGVAPGDRCAVALSGGPDSVALVHLLAEGAGGFGVPVAGVAHLHHGLRGADADGDAAFCRALATRLGLPVHEGRVDVAALARERRCSIEAAGHAARMAFYAEARAALGATLVATGHTANDRAESVLMHLARGAGLRGVASLRPRSGFVVRPLLDVTRAEVEAYLAERQLESRTDASNRDIAFTRNRVRHLVLPALAEHLSPRVVDALARAADLAAEDEAVLADLAEARRAHVVREDGPARVLDLAALNAEPLAVRRRLVERALVEVAGTRAAALFHVDELVALAGASRPGASVSLPGAVAEVGPRTIAVRRVPRGAHRSGRGPAEGPASAGRETGSTFSECQIPVPGVLQERRRGWEFTARAEPPMAPVVARALSAGGRVAVLDPERVTLPLSVRTRRPGDRVRPFGMAGRRKLQDVFVDARVPRAARDEVPLVVDATGRIVWVVGHCLAEDVRVSDHTTGVLLLEFRHLGG